MFWGVILLCLGLSIILKSVFHIDFPFFKVVIALGLIYFGLQMLFGSFGITLKRQVTDNAAVFGTGNFSLPIREESWTDELVRYSVVFGEGRLDLAGLKQDRDYPKVQIDTVFGETKLLIPDNVAYEIEVKTVFADAEIPGGNKAVIGRTVYRSQAAESAAKVLKIKANVVFGSLKIKTGTDLSAFWAPAPASN